MARLEAEFAHHGDTTIPATRQFSGFALSLLAGPGLPIENRFGLRPAAMPDGEPTPLKSHTAADRLRLLDVAAPPHPFLQGGRTTLDALLQSKREIFPGTVLVCATTIWSSTAGGVSSLRRFWRNVASR